MIQAVARNLRRTRLQRGISLSTLSREASISKSTLSELERGRGNPSLDTLWSLARALNVPFAMLFDDDRERVVNVVPLADAPVMASEDGVVVKHLVSRPGRGEIEFYILDLDRGAHRQSAGHIPGMIEHVVVLSGRADVGPADQSTSLGPGDYIAFPADRPHHYRAVAGSARILSIHEYA